jgi:integrase
LIAQIARATTWPCRFASRADPASIDEVWELIVTAKGNRYGHRDAAMILLAFWPGPRAGEVCDLRWDQVDFAHAVAPRRGVKNGTPSTHPIQGDELRALRRLQRESPTSPFVFVSERGSPFTTAGFARMIERAAGGAGLELKARPHMLRLRSRQQTSRHPRDTGLARPSVYHQTAVYTALAPNRFKDFWRD